MKLWIDHIKPQGPNIDPNALPQAKKSPHVIEDGRAGGRADDGLPMAKHKIQFCEEPSRFHGGDDDDESTTMMMGAAERHVEICDVKHAKRARPRPRPEQSP